MTDEERILITSFVERVVRAGGEPIDPAADALLAELLQRHPEARYRIAQMAFFQEHALAESANRIRQLEWELEQARQPKGFLGGLLGGGAAQTPPPAPVHAPGHRPGLFGSGQGGFVGSAAATALGVFGGMMLGTMLASMMGLGGAAQAAEASPLASSPEHETGLDTALSDDEW
ncbi:MAG: DUF2076 family protein [Acetobacteraceae bacterium]